MFQYYDNYTTDINNINVHLTVTVSLRVPPLPAYDLSDFQVILLLFVNLVSCCLLPHSSQSNLTPAHSFYTILGDIAK